MFSLLEFLYVLILVYKYPMVYVNMTLTVITMIPTKTVIEGERTRNRNFMAFWVVLVNEEFKIMYRYVVITGKLEADGNLWAS